MENFDMEKYIKVLPPELQEEAKACKSIDELLKLADENAIELPKEAFMAASGDNQRELDIEEMDNVAGGIRAPILELGKAYCPNCKKQLEGNALSCECGWTSVLLDQRPCPCGGFALYYKSMGKYFCAFCGNTLD